MTNWDWSKFRGSSEGLKWNRKELPVLTEVIAMLERREVVVQAGGNLGIFPKYMSVHFTTVYTFEPDPELFGHVCHNAPERNVVKLQAALGCERETIGISRKRRQQDGGSSHEGIAHVSGAGPIPTLRVDDLGLKTCDLIYLDIEGYELYALRGAAETIGRCRPLIACEVNKSLDEMKEISKEDLYAWFRLHDYDHVKRIRSDEIFAPRGSSTSMLTP